MFHRLRFAFVFLAALVLLSSNIALAQADVPEPVAWNRSAAAKYLDERAEFWLNWSGSARGQKTACISCHTTFSIALALPMLAGKEPGVTEKRLIEGVKKRVANWDRIVADEGSDKDPFVPFYGQQRKPASLGTEAVLNALVLVHYDMRRANGVLSTSTREALGRQWQQQQKNGAWLWLDFGLRPWETEGTYYGASLAALAAGSAGPGYYEQPDIQSSLTSLKTFLKSEFPGERLHHRMMAVWAASRLPGILNGQEKNEVVQQVLSAQQADGAWSLASLGKSVAKKGEWTTKGTSEEGVVGDGYATGLAILTLKSAGVSRDRLEFKKGVAWLAAHQKNGSWPAVYVNKAREPETNVGKFMRDAATAFAVMALTDLE